MKRALFAALALSACATTATPSALRDARAAYVRAAGGAAAELDPADVRVARAELADAESTYRRLGDVAEARDLALVAARRARIAEARAVDRAACPARGVTLTSARVAPPPVRTLELDLAPDPSSDFAAVDRFAHGLPRDARVTIEIPDTLPARDRAESVRARLVAAGVAPARITTAESAATTQSRIVAATP